MPGEPKTVTTEIGQVDLRMPRDRNGTFEPATVPKHARRLDGLSANVISLYAKGLTTGEIQSHLAEMYDTELSRETISKIRCPSWSSPSSCAPSSTPPTPSKASTPVSEERCVTGALLERAGALKVLYLVATQRKVNRENMTGRINNWKTILNALIVHYGDRIAAYR